MTGTKTTTTTFRTCLEQWKFHLRWILWYRATAPFRATARFLARVFTPYRVAIILLALAALLLAYSRLDFDQLLPNIITDLFGVALAVLLIDTIYRVRSDAEAKRILTSKLGSKNNTVASEALKEIEARGWLTDGSLRKAFLLSANLDGNSFTGADMRQVHLSFASLRNTSWIEADLQGAFLDHADLTNALFSMPREGRQHPEADIAGVSLTSANLTGASVRNEQLCRARTLWQATMPDGVQYDGRFNFPDDVQLFLKYARDPTDPSEWARFYGVPPLAYIAGQQWAHANPTLTNPSFSA